MGCGVSCIERDLEPRLIPAFSSERRRSKPKPSQKRHGVNASRSRSEVTPSKRWKTASLYSRVGIPLRGNRLSGGTSRRSPRPLKHVHPTLRSLDLTAAKNAGLHKGARLRPLCPVWAGAHDLEVEVEVEVEVKVKSKTFCQLFPKKRHPSNN